MKLLGQAGYGSRNQVKLIRSRQAHVDGILAAGPQVKSYVDASLQTITVSGKELGMPQKSTLWEASGCSVSCGTRNTKS